MLINEIFESIQGEGPHVGRRAIFIRTAGCNLACKFCDSKYAKNGIEIPVESVIDRISSSSVDYVIFTGGEPSLQMEDIKTIISSVPSKYFAIETNGTIEFDTSVFDHVIVSPKKMDVIDKWAGKDCTFKIVVHEHNVFETVNQLKMDNIEHVYLMPMTHTGHEVEDMERIIPIIIEAMETFGYNGYICPRLHQVIKVK